MTENENGTKTIKPPYLSYKTFHNFIETLRANGIPARIDRSVMSTMSGSNQVVLVQTLKYFKLIDENEYTNERLSQLVKAQGEERKRILREILTESYRFLFINNFVQNATIKQIEEKFSEFDLSTETLRKCVTFFMKIAKDAEVEFSSYIKPYRKRSKIVAPTRQKYEDKPPKIENKFDPNPSGEHLSTWEQQLLEKFPQFDPKWEPEIQAKWFEAFDKLMKAKK